MSGDDDDRDTDSLVPETGERLQAAEQGHLQVHESQVG